MSVLACGCLNVLLVRGAGAGAGARALHNHDQEQTDAFFHAELVSCPSNKVKLEVSQPALTRQRQAGAWLIHRCLACGQDTHAERQDNPTADVLMKKANETTSEAVEKLKSSPNFSPVFKLLVPETSADVETKENMNSNVMAPTRLQTVECLNSQLKRTLQTKLEQVEEDVRLYSDKKYAEFQEYRERAHRDHKILASIINRERVLAEEAPLSAQLPPLQRRRLSSFKDAKKLKHNVVKNTRNVGSEEELSDSEDIFDLEGDVFAPSGNDNHSDADDYDSDKSEDNDEGIQITGRGRGAGGGGIARSMPMNVPKFSQHMAGLAHQPTDDDMEEPQDIAASIKALARSVHGDVFGDLPRPRFSTQI